MPDNIEEIFNWNCMYGDMLRISQPHKCVLPVAKGLIKSKLWGSTKNNKCKTLNERI